MGSRPKGTMSTDVRIHALNVPSLDTMLSVIHISTGVLIRVLKRDRKNTGLGSKDLSMYQDLR